jgi:hypothetical protein
MKQQHRRNNPDPDFFPAKTPRLRHPPPRCYPYRLAVLFNISGNGYTYFSSTPAPFEEEFMTDNPFEIPQALRDVSEQNINRRMPPMSSSRIS